MILIFIVINWVIEISYKYKMGCCFNKDRSNVDHLLNNNNKKCKDVGLNPNNSYKIRTMYSIPKLSKITSNSTDRPQLYTNQPCSLSTFKTDFDRELENMEKIVGITKVS